MENESDHVFEGPEKVLEVEFVPAGGVNSKSSMRNISRKVWDEILNLAKCQILSKLSNSHFDSYVLSESSLFVYDRKVFLKTCGTTTLLHCLPLLLTTAQNMGMMLDWMCYSRKNFQFPEDQHFPHNSFMSELEYAKKCNGPCGEPLAGGAYVLGDLLGEYWYVFCADYGGMLKSQERNVNIMMYGLDPSVRSIFYHRKGLSQAENFSCVTKEAGILGLCPEQSLIDGYQFEPCGYSMNAMHNENFYTVHVTPEEAFSYASFETNMVCDDYDSLVKKVLHVFRPSRFVVTLFGDDEAIMKVKHCPTMMSLVDFEPCKFKRVSQSITSFHDDYSCRMAVYDTVCPKLTRSDLSISRETVASIERKEEVVV